jgi:hypothetical protein
VTITTSFQHTNGVELGILINSIGQHTSNSSPMYVYYVYIKMVLKFSMYFMMHIVSIKNIDMIKYTHKHI